MEVYLQMGSFTSDLIIKYIDGKNWIVQEPFSYRVGSSNSNEIITVPIGYITDFASIPRIFWFIIGHPSEKYGKAAVIHDLLYTNHIYSRKRSDEIFYEAMGVLKVKLWKRKVIYRAVRMFGYWSYKNAGKGRVK